MGREKGFTLPYYNNAYGKLKLNKVLMFSYPIKNYNNSHIQSGKFIINTNDREISIYNAVSRFEKCILTEPIIKTQKQRVYEKIELKNIINLHNHTGIRNYNQIKSMISDIKSNKEILQDNKIPNIKLVKDILGKWVLFDGHHSMLAYMQCGKTFLFDVPHLIVAHEDFDFVVDEQIHIFFGIHASRLKNKDWRHYVINWQEVEEKQLCYRLQKNMGELLDAINSNNLLS
jgi:hypothetical protein